MKNLALLLLNGCLLLIWGCAGTPVKTDAVKADTVKTDTAKTDAVKTDDVKTDTVKADAVKVDISKLAGKYYSPLTPVIYIELKDDGTFDDRFGKRSTKGTYVLDGKRVLFTPKEGNKYEYVFEGDALVFKDGGKLIKR